MWEVHESHSSSLFNILRVLDNGVLFILQWVKPKRVIVMFLAWQGSFLASIET